jgi:hypothetical protein
MNQAESINIDLPRLMTVEPLETADTFVGQSESYGLLDIYGDQRCDGVHVVAACCRRRRAGR